MILNVIVIFNMSSTASFLCVRFYIIDVPYDCVLFSFDNLVGNTSFSCINFMIISAILP